MRKKILTSAAVAAFSLVLSASSVHAQSTRADRAERAQEAAARREYIMEHPKSKYEALTVENHAAFREHMKEYNTQQSALAARVKTHELDKRSSAAQLRAWRESHRTP